MRLSPSNPRNTFPVASKAANVARLIARGWWPSRCWSTYAEYLLNNPTNLSVNASAPSAGNTRFESTTTFTAPGIDPSANQNIVATFHSQSSGFRYRIGTLGTGSSVRLTSLQFTCPNLPAPTSASIPQDFGDALASYGNPRHDIIAGFRLGATVTAESGPYVTLRFKFDRTTLLRNGSR